jgi:alkylhydroperoxidase family enzyme
VSSAAGSSDEKIAAVADWRNSEIFTLTERAALDIAEAMSLTPASVTDEMYAEAQIHFSEAQLVELGATIAMENYRARLSRMFLVESEDRYQPGS